jgi:NADH-ubiquinone oxidoreductase chain 6
MFSAILFGFLVFMVRQTVYATLALAGSFLAVTCLYILLGVEYVGLAYIIVYIGAIIILFLFVVMLIDIQIELQGFRKTRLFGLFFSVVGLAEAVFIQEYFFPSYYSLKYSALHQWTDITLRLVLLNDPVVPLSTLFYNHYFYYLILLGLLLLLVLIGVVIILRFSVVQQAHSYNLFWRDTRLKLLSELGLLRLGH